MSLQPQCRWPFRRESAWHFGQKSTARHPQIHLSPRPGEDRENRSCQQVPDLHRPALAETPSDLTFTRSQRWRRNSLLLLTKQLEKTITRMQMCEERGPGLGMAEPTPPSWPSRRVVIDGGPCRGPRRCLETVTAKWGALLARSGQSPEMPLSILRCTNRFPNNYPTCNVDSGKGEKSCPRVRSGSQAKLPLGPPKRLESKSYQ